MPLISLRPWGVSPYKTLSLPLFIPPLQYHSRGEEEREEAMGRCSRVRHVVWLRQILRRWTVTAAAAAMTSSRRRRSGWAAPSDVPLGHVAVCVGSSSRRFVVRVTHLNHPVFRQLLRQAEEEYGFPSRSGPIALPCDESLFEDVLCLISFSSSSSSSSSSRFANGNLEDCDFNNIC
ncbi:protein SMALL AUXIN UP-REGULATED RNA 12-like [Musa acuminata AAA Group]|uniref:protein SMALL AUXIN UP-REGULATED RNA 12-like n=1 Tax=Musa acuminata AAA Group TaxID=214697 RepID=UPI0031D1ECBF